MISAIRSAIILAVFAQAATAQSWSASQANDGSCYAFVPSATNADSGFSIVLVPFGATGSMVLPLLRFVGPYNQSPLGVEIPLSDGETVHLQAIGSGRVFELWHSDFTHLFGISGIEATNEEAEGLISTLGAASRIWRELESDRPIRMHISSTSLVEHFPSTGAPLALDALRNCATLQGYSLTLVEN